MDTKRFPPLISVFKRNNNVEPDSIRMNSRTMLDFAVSARNTDPNVISVVPSWWARLKWKLGRQPTLPLIALTIYSLKVEIDNRMQDGEVELFKEGMPEC